MANLDKKNTVELTWLKIVSGLLATVLLSSLITWGLITSIAASKTVYDSDISRLDNSIGHIKDATTGLNSYAGYQNSVVQKLNDDTQVKLDEIKGRITDDEANIDTKAAATDLNDFKNSVGSDISNINTMVATKANSGDLTSLQSTVNTKANSSDLTSLQSTVSSKANSSDLDSLKTTVTGLTLVIPSGIINSANCTDRYIWTADAGYIVKAIKFQQSAIEATGATTTLMIKRVPSGTAISSGYDLLTASTPVNLKTGVTANTVLTATLNATTTNLQLAAGDSLALNFTSAITEYTGCVTIVLQRT